MADLILDNTYLIILLPLWIFLIIMSARFFAVYVNKLVIYILTALSSLLGIILCSAGLFRFENVIEHSIQFLKIEKFSLYFGLNIDKLALIFGLILFSISFCVQMFSIFYMKTETKNYRFFAYLNIFNFAMAGLIFSPNLFQMYFFWELVGIISYLLIGFDYRNKEKSEASRRVILINRIGDTAFIAGILFSSYYMYNYAGNLSFAALSFEDMNAISTLLYAYNSTPEFYLICSLFIIAAAVKSAQLPFYTWLQDAMEAKLPVSALLHSATMVSAGIYLIIRLVPIFSLDQNILAIISWIGILTALICSILAAIETNPKKVLAYSTSANLGLIFLSIGMLNIKAAVIFFIAHAFIKSLLFLSLDKIEHYANYITFLIGALSLSGLLFSGITAKEFLFAAIEGNNLISVLYCITAFLTAFYIIRLAVIMIQNKNLVKQIDFCTYLPIFILLLCNIGFYFFIRTQVTYQVAEPFWAGLIGWLAVFILYKKDLLTKFTNTPKLLEKFYCNTVVKHYTNFCDFLNYAELKVFENYKPVVWLSASAVKLTGWIETNIMNNTVNYTAKFLKKVSECDSKLQTRNVQSYNAYAFIIITVIICLVIFGYTYVINQVLS